MRKVVESTLISADGVIGEPHPELTAERLSAELAQRRRAAARGTDHLRLQMALRPIRNRLLLRDPSQPLGLCASSSHAVDLRCAGRIRAEDFPAGRRAFAVLTLQLRGTDFDGAGGRDIAMTESQ